MQPKTKSQQPSESQKDLSLTEGNKLIASYISWGQKEPPKFHSDWNWLMQAVDFTTTRNETLKLGLNGRSARIYTNDLKTYQIMTLTHSKKDTPIMSVWSALVQFIQEYDRPDDVKEA